MTTATFVIAVVALILAATAVAWQVLHLAFGGPRVKANLKRGMLVDGGLISTSLNAVSLLPQPGVDQEALAIEVRNVGRLPVTISAWKVEIEGGVHWWIPNDPLNPALPYRLEPQSVVEFISRAAPVREAVVATVAATSQYAARDSLQVRMSVTLATGRRVVSAETTEIGAR